MAATVVSLAYSFSLVYRRPFRPRGVVLRVWLTAAVAILLLLVPWLRGEGL
jgi:hypothetical protein